MSLQLVLRLVGRDWRSGELRLVLVAVMIAVGTVCAITLFTNRLYEAMLVESASFLAADRKISADKPIPPEFVEFARTRDLTLSSSVLFPSMVHSETGTARAQLVSVKAIEANYPLRGTLRVADVPFGESRPTASVPALGEVWLDSRLFPALDVQKGEMLTIGYSSFLISEVLTSDPARSGSFFDLGPRVLMRNEDVEKTRVIQPGSRIQHELLVAGDRQELDGLFQDIRPQLRDGYRWQDARRSQAQITRALDRAENFLLLGGSLAVLLAGVAIALSARQYSMRHYDHVGILKTLGSTPRGILLGYLGILFLIGTVGVIGGIVVGVVVHFGLINALSSYFNVVLPFPGPKPLVLGAVTGYACLLAFALPPLLALRKVSPMRVIQRDLKQTEASSMVSYAVAIAGSIGLLLWYSESGLMTFLLLAGMSIVLVPFAVIAIALLRTSRMVGMHAGSSWRLALAGLQRGYVENVVQIVVFGLAIMLLLILTMVRTSFLDDLRMTLPENAPNHFLMNIGEADIAGVREFLSENAADDMDLNPISGGRVESVNGEPVGEYQDRVRRQQDFSPGPRLSSGRQLTWSVDLHSRDTIESGEWWSAESTESLVSIEKDYAERWQLNVGDTLTFRIQGELVTARIANTRNVETMEMRMWFFYVLSPGAIASAPAPIRDGFAYMGNFYLPEDRKHKVTDLIRAHPTITVIDVDAILKQVQSIVSRASQAIEWVLSLVFVSGILVLIASIQSSRDRRMREHALVRTLGGTRRLISGSLLIEFAVLGLFAGLVGVVGSQVTVTLLQSEIFELDKSSYMWTWFAGPAIGAALIALVGYISTHKLVDSPPIAVLRNL